MTAIPLPELSPLSRRLWRLAQLIGVALTLALLAGLILSPEPSLSLLWNVAIPILPATFLINPGIWRGVCPLATLNMVSNGWMGRRTLDRRLGEVTGVLGIVLLALLVPARRFLFNTDGLALAVVVAVVALLAIAMGMLFDAKAGFCNAICPVLPVERLYGQSPLASVGNPRCATCSLCTGRGCLDLAPDKSIAQVLGRRRRSSAWLGSWYGVFAAAFPGFVIGYFTLADGPLATAGAVYLHMLLWAAGSLVVTAGLVWAFRLRAAVAFLWIGGAAVGCYYWWASPGLAQGIGWPAGTAALRIAFLGLVGFWLASGLKRTGLA